MILNKIIANKKVELLKRKEMLPFSVLKGTLSDVALPLPLAPALRRPGRVAIIAETKKASPSKGIICDNFDPVKLAREYETAGAAAISVLTEEKFFLGRPSHLADVKRAVKIPVVRKDFIIDPYQVYESRALGADAILLIVAALSFEQLKELIELARELGLSGLVEVHTEPELEHACRAGADIIGINNRDLNTFKTDLNRTFELMKFIDKQKYIVVSESGIKSHTDLIGLKDCGVHAALVGEALVGSAFPGEALKRLGGCSGERGAGLCRA